MTKITAFLFFLVFVFVGDALAASTTWTCLQRGSSLTYTLSSSYRPVCHNTLTFTATVPSGGDPVFSWSVISTSTNGTLPSWNVPPWESSQDISIIGMSLSRKVGSTSCHMYVGSTFNGDNVLDLPIGETGATAKWIGGGAAMLFPGISDAPPSTYFDLHGDSCPVSSSMTMELNIDYIPEGSITTSGVTWNLADKAASITLSGGNLSAAGSGGTFGSVRATQSYSTGKYHWENIVVAVTGATSVVGFGNASMSLTSFVGNSASSAGVQANGSPSYTGMTCVSTGVSFAASDVQTFEIDLDAHKIWLAKNGTWVAGGNPTTGISPWCTWVGTLTLFPAWSSAGPSDTGTARFKVSNFTTSVSSGFLPWDPN